MGPARQRYRDEQWRALRAGMRTTVTWTVIGTVLFVAGCIYAVAARGPGWMALTGAGALLVALGFAALMAWRSASARASSMILGDWARANGWAYAHHRDAAVAGTAGTEPFEATHDDLMLAAEPVPAATPLLRRGDRNYVTDVLAAHLDIGPVRVANHVYEDDRYDGKGRRHTTTVAHLIALARAPSRVDPLLLARRSAIGRLSAGAGDAVAGWGAMHVPDLENDAFRQAFLVQVADGTDPVHVFAVFDPVTQEGLAGGTLGAGLDRVEVEGGWVLAASRGALDGDEMQRIGDMVAHLRWAVAAFAPARGTTR